MAYKDTISEVTSIKKVSGTAILIPALCDVKRSAEGKIVHASGKREGYCAYAGKREVSGSIKEFPLGNGNDKLLDLILSDTSTKSMQEVEIDNGAKKYTGYLTSLKISIPVIDSVTCSIDWVGKSETASTLTKSEITIDAYLGQNVVLTGFPTGKDFESIDLTITNKVTSKYTARGTSQLPSHLAQGYLDIDVNIKYLEDTGIDVLGALTPIASATIVLTSIAGKTLTITLTKVISGENNLTLNEEDIEDFGLTYKATEISFTET